MGDVLCDISGISEDEDGPIGPDVEIDHAGKQYNSWVKMQKNRVLTFSQFIEMFTPRPSNEWAFTENRSNGHLFGGHGL